MALLSTRIGTQYLQVLKCKYLYSFLSEKKWYRCIPNLCGSQVYSLAPGHSSLPPLGFVMKDDKTDLRLDKNLEQL